MVLVKDVIMSALKLVGRGELANALLRNFLLTDEQTETVNTLLYCFNAVEDEVARKYMPLSTSEELLSVSGEFDFTSFSKSPVKIKRVLVNGEEVEYECNAQYLTVNAKRIVVEYEYAPSKKAVDGLSDFGLGVSENLLAFGAAAEYCLINGEIEAAEIWEKKYRKEIDSAQAKLPHGGEIPPRRWV